MPNTTSVEAPSPRIADLKLQDYSMIDEMLYKQIRETKEMKIANQELT